MNTNFRELEPDEIEVRAAQCFENGAKLLLYKDARVDMAILDETVGAMNWQRHHSRENANCVVAIWDDQKNEWVEKEDTGTESNTEKEKGVCSDSFKRSCVCWGIGRSLYSAPDIFVRVKCVQKQNGKGYQLPKDFNPAVSVYKTEKGKIVELELINEKTGETIFTWKKKRQPVSKVEYSYCSTGTASSPVALKPTPAKVEPDDVELPEIDFEEKPAKVQERPQVETPAEYNPDEAFVKSAVLSKTKTGLDYVRIIYAMEHKAEDEEQFQPINQKFGLEHVIETLKSLKVLSETELDAITMNDKTNLERAVKELNTNGKNYHCEVKVSTNARGYKEFKVSLM